jgi:hypothetical protein
MECRFCNKKLKTERAVESHSCPGKNEVLDKQYRDYLARTCKDDCPEICVVKIRRETLGFKSYEYKVPAMDGREVGAYYTNDKQDAIDTAKIIYANFGEIVIKFWNKKN